MILKRYFKDASIGVWFSLAVSVLAFIGSIIYISAFNGTNEFNGAAFGLTLSVFLVSLILLGLRQYVFVPYVQLSLLLPAFMLYIYGMYYYVSIVIVGIDLQSFSTEFIACTVFFVLALVLGVANVFIRQDKRAGGNKNA